ncbi:hypothetical protein N0V88_004151 [Collariella sp. IMI 366227]|nr:hypothetical protein N0V88_004151 [Collariella sp. IMI 366227]
MRPSALKQAAGAALFLSCFSDLAFARKCGGGPPKSSSTLLSSASTSVVPSSESSSVSSAVGDTTVVVATSTASESTTLTSSVEDSTVPVSISSASESSTFTPSVEDSTVTVATGTTSEPSKSSVSSSESIASSSVDATTVPVATTTTSESSDSPPLPTTETVVFPDDPSWTSTYTYDEVELPTYTTSEIDVPNPTVEPFCMLKPDEHPDATFNLLDLQSGFIVSRDGRPGTPAPPTSEEEAEALLANMDNWSAPLFKFEKPAGGPEGMYDLVLEDLRGKHYVSWGSDGTVTFVDQSSASTTLFTVNCRGQLTVRKGGASYTWQVADNGFTEVVPGENEISITVLRSDMAKAKEVSGSSESEMQRVRRLIRRENGWMPRCPNRGSNIFAFPRPNRRNENPNGCGSNNGMGSVVPDFNWGHCCNKHDNCFDDCGKSFSTCNNQFLGCMYDQCGADVKWWNFWMYPGCIATANFYWTIVSSPLGVDAFYTANKERCSLSAAISGPTTTTTAGGATGGARAKTHCSSGGCVCDEHRCGNTCLNMNNHPRNCGRCGNVCASGFCYKGKCYDPPAEPEFCLPGETFTNGQFPNGNYAGWRAETTQNTDFTVEFGVPENGRYVAKLTPARSTDGTKPIWTDLMTSVKLCPGTAYDLRLVMRRPNLIRYACAAIMMMGGRNVILNTVAVEGQGDGTGYGTRIAPFKFGDPGTYTTQKVYVGIDFHLRVMCLNHDNTLAPLAVWGFSMIPAYV